MTANRNIRLPGTVLSSEWKVYKWESDWWDFTAVNLTSFSDWLNYILHYGWRWNYNKKSDNKFPTFSLYQTEKESYKGKPYKEGELFTPEIHSLWYTKSLWMVIPRAVCERRSLQRFLWSHFYYFDYLCSDKSLNCSPDYFWCCWCQIIVNMLVKREATIHLTKSRKGEWERGYFCVYSQVILNGWPLSVNETG